MIVKETRKIQGRIERYKVPTVTEGRRKERSGSYSKEELNRISKIGERKKNYKEFEIFLKFKLSYATIIFIFYLMRF